MGVRGVSNQGVCNSCNKRHEGSHEHCAIEQWLNITLADNKPKRDLFKTRKRCSLHCVSTLPFDGHQCAMCGAKYCNHECMIVDEHMHTCCKEP